MSFLTGFFILLLSLLLIGCDSSPKGLVSYSGHTMGTTYHVTIVADEKISVAQGDIDELLAGVNQTFSTYIDTSEVSLLNENNSDEWQRLSPALISLVAASQYISETSLGAYDITVAPLVDLWGFGPSFKPDDLPSQNDIDKVMQDIGYHKIIVNTEEGTLRKLSPNVHLDFSSIAKGYGVDEVANYIESRGFFNYMVEVGGEMRLRGHNPDGKKWRIAVEKPDSSKRSIQRVIKLSDIAVATSGGYRNFFIKDAVEYSHTIEPKTGNPVQHHLGSVTVLSDKCMTADAWATAFMVLGDKKGYDLAIEQKMAVLFIVKNGSEYHEVMTPEFKRLTQELVI